MKRDKDDSFYEGNFARFFAFVDLRSSFVDAINPLVVDPLVELEAIRFCF